MTPTERIRDDIVGFWVEIHRITSSLKVYRQIKEQRKEDDMVLSRAPSFFPVVHRALKTQVIVSLTKIYEVGRSDRNLMKLVNFIRSKRTSIEWECDEVSHDQVEEHKALLVEQKDVVSKIINRRDSFDAHFDKDYFVNAAKLNEDYPLSFEEIESLIDTAKRIVGYYYEALEGEEMHYPEQLVGEPDASTVFRALGEVYLEGDYSLATSD